MASKKLYYTDSYIQAFQAQVVKCIAHNDGKYAVTLDKTAFYPEGGGQPADTGFLNHIPVLDVQQDGDEIAHIVGKPLNGIVCGRIDWLRRFDYMQQHSGQHILSGAFYKLLNVQTVGFHISKNLSQIDLEIESLSNDDIRAVEDLANRIVFDNGPVKIHFADSKTIGDFAIRKMPAKVFDIVRLIEIDAIDCCPCGGTHVARTGEVGLIKICRAERKNKVMRVEFACGKRALTDYQQKNYVISRLSNLLSASPDALEDAFARQTAKLEHVEKELNSFKTIYYEQMAENLRNKAGESGKICVVEYLLPKAALPDVNMLAKSLAGHAKTIALVGGINHEQKKVCLVFACSPDITINMAEQLKKILPLIEGKGGGNAKMAQGGGSNLAAASQALARAKQDIIDLTI